MALAMARRCCGPPRCVISCTEIGGRAEFRSVVLVSCRMLVLNWYLTPVSLLLRRLDLFQNAFCAGGDRRTRAVDALDPRCIQHLVILPRNHTADKNNDVVVALFLELGDDGGHQGFVAGSQGRDADRM